MLIGPYRFSFNPARRGKTFSSRELSVQIVVEKGIGTGTVFRLHDGVNTLGREVSNRIRLLDPRISRNHCKIRKIGQSLLLSDLGTRNGTSVNGESVGECELQIGDRINLGNTVLRILDEEFEPKQVPEQPRPFSFFRVISMAIFGRRRARKDIWRPPADTDPPESKFKTAVSDPDAD